MYLKIWTVRSEEHTSELQSPVPNSYAVFCLKKKNNTVVQTNDPINTQQQFIDYKQSILTAFITINL